MPYEITIKEVGTERRVAGVEWKEGAGEDGKYGYTPEIEKEMPFEREIYTQRVASMDLVSVIAAVNNVSATRLPTIDEQRARSQLADMEARARAMMVTGETP